MLSLIELFDICNNRRNYTTIWRTDGKKNYEVDYKFLEEEDTLYIFFEPSDGRTDWRVNFDFWRKPYKHMAHSYRVHGGFLVSWKLIEDAIGAKIREVGADGGFKWRKVVIVGYSHGGALAALCHEYVWYNRIDLRNIGLTGISFDGPRVFAGLWIPDALKWRWAHFYVFRNQDDLVTHLPPVVMFFRHVGNKVKVGAKSRCKATVFFDWAHSGFKDKMLFQELVGVKPHYPEEIRKGIMELENDRIPGLDTHVIKIESIEDYEKRD